MIQRLGGKSFSNPPSRSSSRIAFSMPSDSQHLCDSVLVVEDTPAIAQLIRHFVDPIAGGVDFATDGLQAVERAVRQERNGRGYDLILMDIQMPVMSGLEATELIRACGIQIPIIAISAGIQSRDRCLQAGCTAYLTKPIDRQQFVERIEQVLQIR